MINAEKNRPNNSKKLSDVAKESLRKIKEARWKMYEKVNKYGWNSLKTIKQYDRKEVSNAKRILFARVDDEQVNYLMVNIGLPTKSFLRGEQVKQFAPWFRHVDSKRKVTYTQEYPEYGLNRTTRKVNELAHSGYNLKEMW